MTDRVMHCRKCGKQYPVSKMRYFESVKNLLCLNCIEALRNPTKKRSIIPLKKDAPSRQKKRYKCQKCHHIVLIKDGFQKQCGFCGSTNLVLQEWNSDLDSLINESSHKVYEH